MNEPLRKRFILYRLTVFDGITDELLLDRSEVISVIINNYNIMTLFFW